MAMDYINIKIKGKEVRVPSVRLDDLIVIVVGRCLRKAMIFDEEWLEGPLIEDPAVFLDRLKQTGIKADLFTFAQKIPNIKPRYAYPMEWKNYAAIPLTGHADWWSLISTDMRKDVKRAAARGVTAKAVPFDDSLVRGIVGIHRDTPLRQGRAFIHYDKDFDAVKRDYGTYPERSEFIGAYLQDELIGLIKVVYVGELACMMQILSKTRYYDKRPMAALIAKTVEVCEERGKSYLTYGELYYGNKKKSSLVAFKHRSGFLPVFFPRYYIPLTLKGRVAVRLKLHRGLLGMLPGPLISPMIRFRAFFEQKMLERLRSRHGQVPRPEGEVSARESPGGPD